MVSIAYHCSADGNIAELTPQISSHGTPYVYATPYKTISLVFGIKEHCDYIVHPIIDEKGNCTIIEMSPDALAKYYRNKSAYIYQVNKDEFDVQTQWRGEICSTHSIKPLSVEYIPDLEKAILQEQEKGHIQIISYAERNKQGINMDEKFANRELGRILRKDDDIYVEKRINYLKNLSNKEIFNHLQKFLNNILKDFKGKDSHLFQNEPSIIPQKYLEKYKEDYSDDTVCEIFSNLSYCNHQKISQVIDEIKSTENKKLLQKIVFRLTKINNAIKKANKPHVEKKKTRE